LTYKDKRGTTRRGTTIYIRRDTCRLLSGFLEELKIDDTHVLVAQLDSAIHQASGGLYSIRGLTDTTWWTSKHPIPTKEQMQAMADESSPTLYNSEFDSNNESEAQASDSKGNSRTRHKSEPERWWVARRYEVARTRDREFDEVLHLTRYPSKRLFSLIWHPYCNEGRCGKRDDTKLSRPLDIVGWEPLSRGKPERMRDFRELFEAEDIQRANTELQALPAVLMQRERKKGVSHVPETVKAYLTDLESRGEPLEPYPLEHYLKELSDRGDEQALMSLESFVNHASASELSILDAVTSDLRSLLDSLPKPGSAILTETSWSQHSQGAE